MLTAAVALAAVVPAATADRRPTRAEKRVIKRVAMKTCGECEFRGARVSTRNARFAWANVVGEGFSGALLKRPRPRSTRRFRVVGTQGGGIGECSYWRKRAPRRVLRDLRIKGLTADGEVRVCG